MLRLLFFVSCHFAVCVVFFLLVQKPIFGLYNRRLSRTLLTSADVVNAYRYGFNTDLITAAYLTVLPLILAGIYALVPDLPLKICLYIYNIAASLAVSLGSIADTLLYRFWQFKLDASVFTYLRSPKGAFASVSAWYIMAALAAVLIVAGVLFSVMRLLAVRYFAVAYTADGVLSYLGPVLVVLLSAVVLFIIIRGTGIRPNTPAIAYFSGNPYLNHLAVNPLYNLIYSLSVKDDFSSQFRFFDEPERETLFSPLFPTAGVPQVNLLRTKRPDILLIVWESLSARYSEVLGGRPGVLTNFDRLSAEGVLFTRCDAGSFRTDRGLVCLLSGYLGQPTTSLIKYTRKLPGLPALPRRLRDEGYETTAVHGGDLSIMHKSDYYLASGHSRLVGIHDFPSEYGRGKWGVHDGFVFSWLLSDIAEKTKRNARWFTTMQTLSSHEPFDVPYHRINNDPAANSMAYTDECFGRFINALKQSPAWANTLIICTGDHGANFGEPLPRQEYVHIPLLMLGGAVSRPMRIDTIMGQTDLAATLLGQLGMDHRDFMFSRDVLADTYTHPFSFHAYNNGFLLRDGRGYTDYDNVAGKAVAGADRQREETGKAILQTLYNDLAGR